MSNIKNYKYDWIWEKNRGSNFANVKYMPFKQHENISIFYKNIPTYNPQKIMRTESSLKRDPIGKARQNVKSSGNFDITGVKRVAHSFSNDGLKNPNTVLKFSLDIKPNNKYTHPTQKPVELIKYFIRTYTLENETVLDFTCGSGTTGVACIETNRNYILIEQEKKYIDITKKRIAEAKREKKYNLFYGIN